MAEHKDLKRQLGVWDALTIGVGTMIGAGIFLLAGTALELTGPAAILSFLGAGIVCAMTAASTAELATGMPKSGGDYYFVSRSMGPMFGAISGVGIWLSLTFAIAFYLVGMGEYVLQVFNRLAQRFEILQPLVGTPVPAAAAVGGVLLVALNVVGAKQSGRTQLVIVAVLVGILGVLTVGGLMNVDLDNLTPLIAPRENGIGGWEQIFSTTALVFVSFLGFVKIAAVSEEIKNPGVNLPRTLIGSVLIVTGLYVLILVVMGGMFSHTEIGDIADPLSAAGEVIFGPLGAVAVIAAGLLATISSANASVLAASRINLAMARDKMAPGFFSKVHKSFLTPHRAILITGGLSLLFILLDDLELLAQIASVLQLYSYAALNIGCVALRAADPDWYNPRYRAPGYPFVQIFAAGACLMIILLSEPMSILAVGLLIVVSLAWYYVVAKKNVDIIHGVPFLKERWNSIGLAAFFYEPTTEIGEPTEETPTAPVAKRPIEPYSPRRVVVAVANPAHDRDLLKMGSLIAAGYEEPGQVFGLHAVQVPFQTTLEAARTRLHEQKAVQRIQSVVDEMNEESVDDGLDGSPIEFVPTVAHDPFAVLMGETENLEGDMLLMGWRGGFSIGRIHESPVQTLIREATCDMAVLKDRGLSSLDDILLPWGGGVHARLGLEIAARIARSTGATIHLLRVVKPEVDVESEERDVVESVTAIVDDVVEVGDVDIVYHVQRAERITDGIRNHFDAQNTDLVIIGASHEWKLRNVLFGTIPDVIADNAPCSVLMVRRFLPQHWSFQATEGIKRLRERVGFTSSPEEE